jgi:hypothetical protein
VAVEQDRDKLVSKLERAVDKGNAATLVSFHSPLKSGDIAIWREEGADVAPKPARFAFAFGMALTILAVMTWAVAAPSSSPIYHPQLLLLY